MYSVSSYGKSKNINVQEWNNDRTDSNQRNVYNAHSQAICTSAGWLCIASRLLDATHWYVPASERVMSGIISEPVQKENQN